jgi:outer membrane protein OmpA-like peptidoglycan-associated protein
VRANSTLPEVTQMGSFGTNMLVASAIFCAVSALSCGPAASQDSSRPEQRLAQAEPRTPGEEKRKDKQPPGQQPAAPKATQTAPTGQAPGAPRSDQRQDTQDHRPPGPPKGTAQQPETPGVRPGAPSGAGPGGPAQTNQPGVPQRQQTQERKQLPGTPVAPGGAQPQVTQPKPGQPQGVPQQTQQDRRPIPGAAQPGAAQPGVAQPGQPGAAKPQTTQPKPGQGMPPQPQQTLQPQAPGTPPTAARPAQPQTPGTPSATTPQPGRPSAAVGEQRFEAMRQQRQERVENNGQRTVIEEPDHRMIIREGGRAFVRHDETVRFRATGQDVRVERRGGEVFTVVRRPGDVEIVTVVDENGRLLRRVRRTRDGREFVLIDNRRPDRADIFIALPAPRIVIPREEYIVEIQYAPRERIFAALEAPPIERIERPYTLDEIRFSPALRDRMRRVDLDTINFEFGSWEVVPDQVQLLANIAEAMNAVIRRNPNEMFLIEGHTDAVGNDVDNLSLSDRRAESVALILTRTFEMPPENLTTQGYGAQQLKVPTSGPSRENRRVTVRRITPLLTGSSQ